MISELLTLGEVVVLSLVMLVGWFACLAPRRAFDWFGWFGRAHPWSKRLQKIDQRLALEHRMFGMLIGIFSGALIATEVGGMLLRRDLRPETALESILLLRKHVRLLDIVLGAAMVLAGAYLILRPQDLVRPKLMKPSVLLDVGASVRVAITIRIYGIGIFFLGSFILSLWLKTFML